jgi:hypothetical protein
MTWIAPIRWHLLNSPANILTDNMTWIVPIRWAILSTH